MTDVFELGIDEGMTKVALGVGGTSDKGMLWWKKKQRYIGDTDKSIVDASVEEWKKKYPKAEIKRTDEPSGRYGGRPWHYATVTGKKVASDGGGDRSYDITSSSWPKELKKMKKGKGPKAAWQSMLKRASLKKMPITSRERARFKAAHGDPGCSLGRDKNGYFAYTHRARSPSYPSPESIPKKRVRFVASTG